MSGIIQYNKYIKFVKGDYKMEAKVTSINEFKAVGITYFGNNINGEISKLWQVFNSRYNEIGSKNKSRLCYGVCEDMPDAEGRFHYTACAEVDSFVNIPEGMETKVVPAGKYAVYTFNGSLDKIGEFYDNIFAKWMPEAGYTVDARPQFELYDERYMDNGEFDLYMPIK